MLIITTTTQLKELVTKLKRENAIAIDTEFVRRETYYAKLCLIQIATSRDCYIIDPLNLELDAFSEILTDKKIVKVLHAPLQDIGIFYNILGIYTANVFDTQEAAKLCGIKNQISYQDLCQKALGVHIDKEQQFRDWQVRPLPQDMLDYAAQDVTHLLRIYEKLRGEMFACHCIDKFYEAMDIYNHKEFYLPDLEKVWTKIKTNEKAANVIKNLQMLAAFREEAAMKLDLPRQHVINDNALVAIAKNLPTNAKDFARLSIRSRLDTEQLEELFDLCLGILEV